MFAVFNHLSSIFEIKLGILNLLNYLNDDGVMIIDFTIIGNLEARLMWLIILKGL